MDSLGNGQTLIVGQSLRRVDETRKQLAAVLIFGSLAAIAAAVIVAWWLVRAGLRPLRRVEASAAAITDSDLDLRVPGGDQPTEVGNLAAALNEMLDRLQLSSEEREQTLSELRASESRMRRFVADASHELRTPIAATAAYAELFEHGARDRPQDLDRAMSGIRRETSRMAGLVDDLLLLARLDEHRHWPGAVDLVELDLARQRRADGDRPTMASGSARWSVKATPARQSTSRRRSHAGRNAVRGRTVNRGQ